MFLLSALFLLCTCSKDSPQNSIYVTNSQELNTAILDAVPGDLITLANGIWKDVEINFKGTGTQQLPITLRAETPGKVFIEGTSYLHLGGEFLVVDGLYFRNGHTPKSAIIRYMIGEDHVAFNCRVTNTIIEDFTQPSRLNSDRWIEFFGKHNQLDHCYITGKSNDGETIRVFFTGNEHINTHHQIINNYFGPRPRKGGPRGETIRVGDSKTRVSPGYVNVSNNYFEACNGEVEIISDKTNFNSYTNNIFYKCEGSLVLRHGSYATVDRNIFIGGDDSNFYGGIRVVNSGHWITNNYFYKIKGKEFRAPLAIMNGIPMTPLNRYLQVSDVVVAFNTWVDCESTWQIGVGQNLKSADVLPPSEIRSAPPIRSTIANNIIYNTQKNKTPFINHSEMDGIEYEKNVIDNNRSIYTDFNVLLNIPLHMTKINDWLYAPDDAKNNILNDVFLGYDFAKIDHDLFGVSREKNNRIGAIVDLNAAKNFKIDKSIYGPKWFTPKQEKKESKILMATAAEGDLSKKIATAKDGDIIELTASLYTLTSPLSIDKDITIRAKDSTAPPKLVYTGNTNTPAFKMHPKGILHLEHINLKGNDANIAFAPLRENMKSAYNIYVHGCTITNFNYILKAYKATFADNISIINTTFKDCKNGLELAAEDEGNYNAELVTINHCEFINVHDNVINFLRDGYDETTIGGILTVSNSSFTNSGNNTGNGILLQTKGIVNVELADNTFTNNPVTHVAVLWGKKNNHETNNTILNSGTIKVEDQLKLKILY